MEVFYSKAQAIMHSRGEFYIDFYLLSADKPNVQSADPTVRVYMNPEAVMAFRDALEKNVGSFIQEYLKPKKEGKGGTNE